MTKKMIRSTLDQYLEEDQVPAKTLHEEAKQRHGDAYRSPDYIICVCFVNGRN